MRILVVLALCLAVVAGLQGTPQRIVGGSVTTINQYPTIAALLYSWNFSVYSQACGGTIITNRAVLTAAHCTIGDAANRWRIRVGSTWANSGGVVYTLAQIINHPSYDSRTLDHDVAVLRPATYIDDSNVIQIAPIAESSYTLPDGQVVYGAGWGAISQGGPASEQLRHVQIWTVNQNTCAQRYAAVGRTITANMLCSGWLDVGGRDQCQGDSGGPLYHNGVVVGVSSWGLGCAHAYYPGVNARVSRYAAWIKSNA